MRAIITPPQSQRPALRSATKAAAVAFAALALACGGAQAQPRFHGYHGYHGGWGAGPFWGLLGLGVGLTLADSYAYPRPGYVVVDQQPSYYYVPPPPAPMPVYAAPAPAPAPAPAADPIFYPRNGQTTAQAEADRRACNDWAATVPRATTDASIFQRATLACMDGRGYTSR